MFMQRTKQLHKMGIIPVSYTQLRAHEKNQMSWGILVIQMISTVLAFCPVDGGFCRACGALDEQASHEKLCFVGSLGL